MKTDITYCENCRDDMEYCVESTNLTRSLKDERIEYEGLVAKCKKCHGEVYVAEIEDENLNRLYEAYREAHDIISLKKILEIPNKYSIGKRPLSIALGWGEMTYTRYSEGYIPKKKYSDLLKKIYDDPRCFLNILEKNKDKLTDGTYNKSKTAAEGLINDGYMDINLVSEYIVNSHEGTSPMELQKLLYYIQGFSYVFLGHFLFREDCQAWTYGPVFPEIYHKYPKDSGDIGVSKCDHEYISQITGIEKNIIDSVIKNFGCYSAWTLSKFTHAETPWVEARRGKPDNMICDTIISKESIASYFKKVDEKCMLLTPEYVEEYAKNMFEKIH